MTRAKNAADVPNVERDGTVAVDEETPLLEVVVAGHGRQKKKKMTPLPWFQFSIVMFLQLAEPLTSQVISPFMPQLIRDLGITGGNEAAVGYYVGMMQSIFFLTQALTILHWSRLSDSIGRKPVILIGLSGLTISMYSFGLSRTFWGLVLSRSLNGALNGNIGVIKSMMAELTDETNISMAYAYFPIAWSSGSTLGPIIGGSLSKPAERFPGWFGNSEFHKKYPYFLACAVPATYSLISFVVIWVYLKETLPNPTPIRQYLTKRQKKPTSKLSKALDSQDPGQAGISHSLPVSGEASEGPNEKEHIPLRSLLTRRVITAAGNYAAISLVDIAFRAIQPLFLSTPIEKGGLGLPPHIIGNLMSVYGIMNGFLQVFFFAKIVDRWGAKKTFIGGMISAIPAFACYPLLNMLARSQGLSNLVWILAVTQILISIGMGLCYGSVFIFIAAAAPNRASLGATNGLSQMTVSVMRAIGPGVASSLFSLSIAHNLAGGWLVYYILIGVVVGALYAASFLPKRLWAQAP
ncbi:member of major facilitator superfamily multidrug-resistance, DHA1 sub-family [Coprinopsis marcescibilis]|uniref:Member of major facilitator superfamily multidrug-resistance, DHA1 sub-family n=1 Tax=Coprinopsis marcescibilis TaxID=230819 RepID=A0A5C3L470_COPMA|nr:member of major facilitator superfamily multidrug-resistance, DHA1 sub-family [Coprinopsis marcescibilis]